MYCVGKNEVESSKKNAPASEKSGNETYPKLLMKNANEASIEENLSVGQ